MSDTTMTVVDGAATPFPALVPVRPVRSVRGTAVPFRLTRLAADAGGSAFGAAGAAEADDAATYVGSTRGIWATAGAEIDQLIGAVRRPVTTDHNSTFRGRPRGRPV